MQDPVPKAVSARRDWICLRAINNPQGEEETKERDTAVTFLFKALNKARDDDLGTPMDSLQTPDFSCITDHPFGAFPTLRDETSHGC